MKASIPANKRVGKAFSEKLLGALFSISSLPKRPEDKDENFDKNSIMVSMSGYIFAIKTTKV